MSSHLTENDFNIFLENIDAVVPAQEAVSGCVAVPDMVTDPTSLGIPFATKWGTYTSKEVQEGSRSRILGQSGPDIVLL